MKIDGKEILKVAKRSLEEDLGGGDITTQAVISPRARIKARITARSKGVIAGREVVNAVFRLVDRRLRLKWLVKDGNEIKKNTIVASISGHARPVLTAERTALNFLGHMSGIATLTKEFVKKTDFSGAKIFDTRKTTPGLRIIEKYAVRAGGGRNHRFGLYDQVLLKDNHIMTQDSCMEVNRGMRQGKTEVIASLIRKAKEKAPARIKVEVEVDNVKQFEKALEAGADIIMLDNMKPSDVRKAVKIRNSSGRKTLLEVSGGITLENVRSFARTGVEMISVGALTHSAPALDFSLEVIRIVK